MTSRRIRFILLIIWLILAGLIVWFKVVPLGQVTYSLSYPAKINILGGRGFIGHFTPLDRLENKADQAVKIINDPVYFSIFTPRTFSQAKLTVTYQNNLGTTTPIIEAGVLVDNVIWRYKLASLENNLIDAEFKNWNQLREGDILLLQKTKKFFSVAEFLETLKNKPQEICQTDDLKVCLVLYNTDSLNNYFPLVVWPTKIASFKPIDIPLQGTHQFYFIKPIDQEATLAFDFTDLNLNKDIDQVELNIYQGENKVYSKIIKDNFGGESIGQVRNFSTSFSWPQIDQFNNLFKLEIKVNDDIVIKKITKAPSALNVIGRIHPVATSKVFSLWTDSSFIQVTTNNPASRQLINFGDKNFSLANPYQQFEFFNSKIGLKEIQLTRDDIILANDSIFSFAPTDFFNPEFKHLDRHFVLNNETKYILANYKPPQIINNNLKQATVIINTQEAYREKGKYSFMISIPGLSLAGQGSVTIKEIKVEFRGRTIWDKLKEKIRSYVN